MILPGMWNVKEAEKINIRIVVSLLKFVLVFPAAFVVRFLALRFGL